MRCTTCGGRPELELQNPFKGSYIAGFTVHSELIKTILSGTGQAVTNIASKVLDAFMFALKHMRGIPDGDTTKYITNGSDLIESVTFGPGLTVGLLSFQDSFKNPFDFSTQSKRCNPNDMFLQCNMEQNPAFGFPYIDAFDCDKDKMTSCQVWILNVTCLLLHLLPLNSYHCCSEHM